MKQSWLALGLLILAAGCPTSNESPDSGIGNLDCTVTTDCAEGRICSARQCREVGTVRQNGQCTATRDCESGLFCEATSKRCVPAISSPGVVGSPCVNDGQCTVGLRCDFRGFTGICVETEEADRLDGCSAHTDCLAGLYCSPNGRCDDLSEAFPEFPGVSCPPDTGPFRGHFEVPRPGAPAADFYRLPYPNDVRVDAEGNVDLSSFPRPGPSLLGPDIVDLYVDTLTEDFDGFSGTAPVAFRFSKPIDFGFFAGAPIGNVLFFDLDTGIGLFGFGFTWTPSRNKFACENFLTIYPTLRETPLKAGHTYMVALLSGNLRSDTGEPPTQDADLAAVLATTRPTGDEALGRAWDLYAPMRAFLASNLPQVDPATIVNATVFTVQDPTVHMSRLATAVAAQPAPVLSELFQCGVSTGTDPCDDGTPARRCGAVDPAFHEIHGKIRLPIFQTGTAPYLTPQDGGGLNEQNGAITKVRDEEVCFALSLPAGTPPAGGWPLVVHGHGTGGSFRSFIADGVAAELAGASPKAAVIGIDLVGHGARRAGSTRSPEELVFNVVNPRAARDNFAQGAADLMTVSRVPDSPAPAGWTGPMLRFADDVVLFGHSQGATHASLALPFATRSPAAVLSGAGALLGVSLLTKTSPQDVRAGLSLLLDDAVDSNHPMIHIWQHFFDRADPANFNRHIWQTPLGGLDPKDVLMTWGRQDTFAPDETLHANAATLFATPVGTIRDDAGNPLSGIPDSALPPSTTRPVTLDDVHAVVTQYDPPQGVDGHFVAFHVPAAIADWKAFITTFFSTGTPTLP